MTINMSYAIAKSTNLSNVVEIINEGTCEGMEGMEFSPADLAGQYAEQASRESGYEVDEDAIEANLDILVEAGAKFSYSAAVERGLSISSARED